MHIYHWPDREWHTLPCSQPGLWASNGVRFPLSFLFLSFFLPHSLTPSLPLLFFLLTSSLFLSLSLPPFLSLPPSFPFIALSLSLSLPVCLFHTHTRTHTHTHTNTHTHIHSLIYMYLQMGCTEQHMASG